MLLLFDVVFASIDIPVVTGPTRVIRVVIPVVSYCAIVSSVVPILLVSWQF